MAYALDKERLVCGWTAPPQPRTDFAQWRDASPLSYAQALEMAQQGYGYFVSVDTEQPYPLAALAAAKENGYLPPNFPRDKTALEQPITGGAFAELMKLACKGRNRLTPETLAAKALGGTLSGEEAAAYALALEQAATGCTCQANPKQAATGCTRQASPKQAAPAGS